MNETSPVVAVLDDEPQMRKALRRLLASHGFRVEEYECGKDFLEELPSHPADCLVLDLHMPGVNGFDVLEAATAADALRDAMQYVPDVVLLDLGLPDMDGQEVIRRLREWINFNADQAEVGREPRSSRA